MSGFERRAAAALADPLKRANVPPVRRAGGRQPRPRARAASTSRRSATGRRGGPVARRSPTSRRCSTRSRRSSRRPGPSSTGPPRAPMRRAYVTEVVLRHGRMVVKGKSMAAEEIGLNERLEAAGVEVVETDLGEFIVQTAGEAPEHIIIPAIHKTTDQVRELFEPLAGTPDRRRPGRAHGLRPRPPARAASSRRRSGSPASTSRSPRPARSCSSRTRATAACARRSLRCTSRSWGWSASSPTWPTWRCSCRSSPAPGTGQKITSYVTLLNGPRRGDEEDGPEEMHVVILDNGRSRVRETPYRSVAQLHPLRRLPERLPRLPPGRRAPPTAGCTAGPIGAVLTPLLHGDQELGPRLVAVRRVRRRVPGQDPAARAAPRPAPRPRRRLGGRARAAGVSPVELRLEPAPALPAHGPAGRAGPRAASASFAAGRGRETSRCTGDRASSRASSRPSAGTSTTAAPRSRSLRGEGVSVTPCLALIAETGTAVVSARLSAGRRRGSSTPCTSSRRLAGAARPRPRGRASSSSAPSWRRRRRSRSSPARAAPPTSSRT